MSQWESGTSCTDEHDWHTHTCASPIFCNAAWSGFWSAWSVSWLLSDRLLSVHSSRASHHPLGPKPARIPKNEGRICSGVRLISNTEERERKHLLYWKPMQQEESAAIRRALFVLEVLCRPNGPPKTQWPPSKMDTFLVTLYYSIIISTYVYPACLTTFTLDLDIPAQQFQLNTCLTGTT